MNDNKSTVMNNAAVQQLRKVPGFDPMKLLRKTISVKTGHPVWKLDLRYTNTGWPLRRTACRQTSTCGGSRKRHFWSCCAVTRTGGSRSLRLCSIYPNSGSLTGPAWMKQSLKC